MFQVYDSNTNDIVQNIANSSFIDEFRMKWDDLHENVGIFRYQIETIHERIIDEKYLLQLNPNRATKRRIPESFDNICHPFDHEKFNFTKVPNNEVLFTLTKDNDESDKHAILVNVSPINRYHSLLCPSIDKCLPQVVTQENLKLALDLMHFIEDRSLKIGFNSLCALASVNHLHYHLLFEGRRLAAEDVECKQIKGPLHCLDDYVVPTFCFDVTQNVEEAARDIFKLLLHLQQKSIAHNILLTWRPRDQNTSHDVIRAFIWPRKKAAGVKQLGAFNIAVCELSGWFPMYNIPTFANMKREFLEDELKQWKYEDFNKLCDEVKSLY